MVPHHGHMILFQGVNFFKYKEQLVRASRVGFNQRKLGYIYNLIWAVFNYEKTIIVYWNIWKIMLEFFFVVIIRLYNPTCFLLWKIWLYIWFIFLQNHIWFIWWYLNPLIQWSVCNRHLINIDMCIQQYRP